MKRRSVQDRVALVSGASRGIGRAIAVALAREGMDVACLARSEEELRETAAAVEAEGHRALVLRCDATDRGALEAAVARARVELGPVHVLVNNAGIMVRGSAQEADLDAWQRALDVNVMAMMAMTRFCLPQMIEAGGGAVVNVASVAGHMSFPGGGAYCASKHAVIGYTHSLYEDVREHGIKVSAISPGYVATAMVAAPHLVSERMIQPEDVAAAVVFVATFADTGCPAEILLRPQRSPYRREDEAATDPPLLR